MTKSDEEKIWKMVYATSIPEEIKAVYELANSVDLMAGFDIGENGKLKSVREYLRYIKYATEYFLRHIEKEVVGATFDIDGTRGYEAFQNDSRELAHLNIKYLDRTAKSTENAQKVFDLLNALPSGGLFNDKDFDRYKRQDK